MLRCGNSMPFAYTHVDKYPKCQKSTWRKKCSYSELFWSVLSEYSFRMRENTYQNNSEHGQW